jgi:hypothetical protein
VETLALPTGLKLKAGRFLSGVGYLNQQHPHEWDFSDAPLAYKAFFGYRLQNDGVQLRWVAPTALFFELGAEAANGGKFPGPSARPTAPASGRPSPTWAATSATRRRGGWACPTCAPIRGSGLRRQRLHQCLLRPQPDLDRRFRLQGRPTATAATPT